MKQIDITKMSENEKKEVLQESRLLEVLKHPNIVKFIEVYKTKKGKLCIIMDYADGKIFTQQETKYRGRSF
jgi:NIMA (never in mitosis gene a)-related kinase 1/4/5